MNTPSGLSQYSSKITKFTFWSHQLCWWTTYRLRNKYLWPIPKYKVQRICGVIMLSSCGQWLWPQEWPKDFSMSFPFVSCWDHPPPMFSSYSLERLQPHLLREPSITYGLYIYMHNLLMLYFIRLLIYYKKR